MNRRQRKKKHKNTTFDENLGISIVTYRARKEVERQWHEYCIHVERNAERDNDFWDMFE